MLIQKLFDGAPVDGDESFEFIESDALIDAVNGGVERSEFNCFIGNRADEARIGRAAGGVEFGVNAGAFKNCFGQGLRHFARSRHEGARRALPSKLSIKTGFCSLLFNELDEPLLRPARVVADVEGHLALSRDDVDGALACVNV